MFQFSKKYNQMIKEQILFRTDLNCLSLCVIEY